MPRVRSQEARDRRVDDGDMDMPATRGPVVISGAEGGGTPLGSSGRARLKVLTSPPGETGYAMIEALHPPRQPKVRDHVHARHDEAFVVMAGAYEVRLGDQIVVAKAGDYVFVPRGTPHTYRNATNAPARVVNVMSPADGVGLLTELGALAGQPVDDETLAQIHARHAASMVEPLPDW